VRSVEEVVEERQKHDPVSDAAARIETLIDSVMGWACAPNDPVWVRAYGRAPDANGSELRRCSDGPP
jgi:hypothetical protein